MASEWDRGVLDASSWHGLETVATMVDVEAMLAHGYASGAWPIEVRRAELAAMTAAGPLPVARRVGEAIVASYQAPHPDRALGLVGTRYVATTPREWADTMRAATLAGAVPSGAFALRGGTQILGTFRVDANGTETHLLVLDSFDGSTMLQVGFTSVRVVCANTLAISLMQDGRRQARVRHTASLPERVEVLGEAIQDAIREGRSVRDAYHAAEETRLHRDDAEAIFDRLFPRAPSDADKRAVTQADNARTDARRAMEHPANNAGPTVATLWNAATWLVDRTPGGRAKPTRGGSALESMLTGSRGERVTEIQTLIQVCMRDGTVRAMPAPDAIAIGASPSQVGRALLADMLG